MIENEYHLNEDELKSIVKLIKEQHGYDFTEYSESSLKRRLTRFLTNEKIKNVNEFNNKITNNLDFFALFLENITVNVTEMFRDPSFYNSLIDTIFPELNTYPFIKIWVAGCSTGQEMYSLAILLYENKLLDRCIIYGTDINPKVIKQAKKGIFPIHSMKDYTANYFEASGRSQFSKYYSSNQEEVIFGEYLSKNMVFSVHNLVTDQIFNEFHLVLCRNVMIYFNKDLQKKVLEKFHECLVPQGFLGIGIKERLIKPEFKKLFKELDSVNKIYKKIN